MYEAQILGPRDALRAASASKTGDSRKLRVADGRRLRRSMRLSAGCKPSASSVGVECRLSRPTRDSLANRARLMNKPPRKKNPTFGIAVFIVVAVLLVIATLFYNAITEKRDFDNQKATAPSM